jgi:hypothetical protein
MNKKSFLKRIGGEEAELAALALISGFALFGFITVYL